MLLAMLPDADVILLPLAGFGGLLGHRGLTHSLAFAAVCGTAIAGWLAVRDPRVRFVRTAALLSLAMASHGVLDAATNGGSGIAFLSPFSDQR